MKKIFLKNFQIAIKFFGTGADKVSCNDKFQIVLGCKRKYYLHGGHR